MLAGLHLISAALLSLALSADAGLIKRDSLPVTLPFARRLNLTGTSKILEIDQARAKALKTRASSISPGTLRQNAIFNAPAANQAVDYTTTVSISCFLVDGTTTLTVVNRSVSVTRRKTVGAHTRRLLEF